jgi:sulfur carrier protein
MPKQLLINGEPKETDAQTVRDLLVQMGLGEQPVAVEVNRQVVPRKQHELTPLKDGDTLELVTLVGGG